MFSDVYNGKKVLVTGHTGFKGSWLCQWLLKLGADVVGYSKDVPTNPSLFEVLDQKNHLTHNIGDVRDLESLRSLVLKEKPDFLFHLAAQAIVSTSYNDPIETITTNVLGTMNVLEVLRDIEHKCVVVMITSDKCYENVEWLWGYKETDQLGGKDIYSGSKGAAELVIHSYQQSFYKNHKFVRIGTGRAGNVIGGGDWATDRIVVDTVTAWEKNQPVEIRCPEATRPWQHVLEPLSGYLCLGEELWLYNKSNHEAFNFGPSTPDTHRVTELLSDMHCEWFGSTEIAPYTITANIPFNEAGLLKLNCDKAKFFLNWTSSLTYSETVSMIVSWYKAFYHGSEDISALTNKQITFFEDRYSEMVKR